jgi:pyruvate kinase
MPVLHPLDEADLRNYAVQHGFDIVVLPFSIRKKDVNYIKDIMGPEGAHI